MKSASSPTGLKQFCTFYLDSFLLGIETHHVREIIRLQGITPVPQAPPAVRGLMNLRGEIIPVLDLRRCLDLPESRPGSIPLVMVLHYRETVVSILIDRIAEVLIAEETHLEPAPETLQGLAKQWIKEVYKLKAGLLLIPDLDQLSSVMNVRE
jgi:purine-binding chemotaxis protein CheW